MNLRDRVKEMAKVRQLVMDELFGLTENNIPSPEKEQAIAVYTQTICQAEFADEICADIDKLSKDDE